MVIARIGPFHSLAGPEPGAIQVTGILIQPGCGFGILRGQPEDRAAQSLPVGIHQFLQHGELRLDASERVARTEEVVGLDQNVPLLPEVGQHLVDLSWRGRLQGGSSRLSCRKRFGPVLGSTAATCGTLVDRLTSVRDLQPASFPVTIPTIPIESPPSDLSPHRGDT